MVKKRHMHTPAGFIQGRKQGQKTVFKTALLMCAAVSMFSASHAFAQSQTADNAQSDHVQNDQAIIATTTPDATTEQALPNDLQPEVLKTPTARTINPKDIKRQKRTRSNRWNPQTLTQPTGLSAASQRAPQPIARPIMQADIMPTDLLSAQDLLKTGDVPTLSLVKPLETTTRSDGVINLSSSLRGALFDLSNTDNVNASVFKLDLGGQPCLGTAIECQANDNRRIDFGYAKNITKGKKNGFNLQLTPHGGLRVDDTGQSALVGALVRIGDNLREGSEMKSNTWYLFAGADAEALTYTPNSARRLTSGEFHLQDRIIIGDAQAGVGYRLGDADLALTYYKRQAKAENYSYDENAAALSITWKR